MKVKLAHEHPYSEKNKARKMKKPFRPVGFSRREGPRRPRKLTDTLYLKALERGSSVFWLKKCTDR